jgi:type II secretory pathway pseudopilin PulG
MTLIPVHLLPASRRPRRLASRARGFSLVEAMVSAGIVGVMLVASVNLLSSAARTRAADSNHRTGLLLAQQLMAEVQTQPYKDEALPPLFGPELGETGRATYDDIDDYNDYREKPPKDRNGTAMPTYQGWERRVKVEWVSPVTLHESLIDTGLVMIEVRVSDPRGQDTYAYALRSERAVPVDPPLSGSTYVQWTEIELEVDGETPRHATTGVNPLLRPPIK